ncbi:MAG TPA: pyridoxal-dependent decarboxylase [Acidimicrobiales bacterium]|jgi:aromatic-L-amino-acid decarboxylase|nr:pyridoxal-dependent decarboxylase [Acidimicrobiales bacterium]
MEDGPTATGGYHLTPAELHDRGQATLEWIVRYLEQVEDLPVGSRVAPGDVRAALPAHAPEHPEPFDEVLADLDRVIVPGLTHWQSPNFFGYFPANSSGPGVLGDLVSSALGVNGMLWATSPACTELETLVLDWLVDALALPDRFRSTAPDGGPGAGGGVIQDSASSATLCAVVAARERALARHDRATIAELDVFASDQAHSSFYKGARIAGFRPSQIHLVPSSAVDAHAMSADALDEMVVASARAGRVPCFVMATAGTTSSLAFDPVGAIGDVAARHGMWLHVDAAMAGSAAVAPELRWVNDGVEAADSYAFNPHKWLFTNFDCDCFWVADRNALIDALSVTPEYLRNDATSGGEVIDYRDWQIPLGRRFRSLKLWFVLRSYGLEGLRYHVRRHVELTKGFAARVLDDPRFELAAPPALSLVCLRHVAGDEVTARLLADANATGRVLLTHTRLDGRYVIRASIGQTHTEARHVDALWDLLDSLAPPAEG